MTEELMKIPGVLRRLNVENNQKLMTLFDVDWRPEKIQEIIVFEHNLRAFIMTLNTRIQHMDGKPYRHVNEILNTLARIYLELDKCVKYVEKMDSLIMDVLTRDSQNSVPSDEN
jgi:hypothetical protein